MLAAGAALVAAGWMARTPTIGDPGILTIERDLPAPLPPPDVLPSPSPTPAEPVPGIALHPLRTTTLVADPSRAVLELGAVGFPFTSSDGRLVVALPTNPGIGDGSGALGRLRPEALVVDVRTWQVRRVPATDVGTAHLPAVTADALIWAERELVVLQPLDGSEPVRIPLPAAVQVAHLQPLGAGRVGLLLAPDEGVGPVRVAVADAGVGTFVTDIPVSEVQAGTVRPTAAPGLTSAVATGEFPTAVWDAAGERVWVVGGDAAALVDLAAAEAVTASALPPVASDGILAPGPGDVALTGSAATAVVDTDDGRLFVGGTRYDVDPADTRRPQRSTARELVALDAATMQVVGSTPVRGDTVLLGASGSRLVVTAPPDGSDRTVVRVLDAASLAVLLELDVGGGRLSGLSPDGWRAYVETSTPRRLVVISLRGVPAVTAEATPPGDGGLLAPAPVFASIQRPRA